MSGRCCEDGVEEWWAATCPLGYDEGEVSFRVTEIELCGVSAWISAIVLVVGYVDKQLMKDLVHAWLWHQLE